MPQVIFIETDGTERAVDAPVGLSLLEIAHMHNIDIEGACEGSLACSTRHVIIDPTWFLQLDEPDEDEEDMLDFAFGLTRTSRLGCQIIMTEKLDGLTVRLWSYGSCVADLYNRSRTHLSLDKDTPSARPILREGRIQSIPHIGGLHHSYVRM